MRWEFVGSLVGALALGCGGGDDEPEVKRGPVTDPGTGLTVAACGMPAYALLPSAEVGKLVSHEPDGLSYTPAGLDALVKLAKIKADPTPHGAKLFLFRYTTQAKGRAVEATAMLAYPSGGAPLPKDPPVVLWLHGTTGWSDACSPGANTNWQGMAAFLAGQGTIVVAPDFIGMNSHGDSSTVHHPYMVAEPTAIASWDAMPAAGEVLAQIGGGLALGKRVVIAGASQGGHATLFTERFGAYYAPEWEVVAQAAIVPASSVTAAFTRGVGKSPGASMVGLTAAMLVAARSWYGSPKSLSGVLTDSDPDRLASRADEIVFEGSCGSNPLSTADPAQIYEPPFLEAARAGVPALDPWGCYFGESSIATTSNPAKKAAPTLYAVAENDELIPAPDNEPDVATLCAQGYSVQHLSCKGETHANGALSSVPHALSFIRDRWAGKPMDAASTCKLNAPACCAGSTTCTP